MEFQHIAILVVVLVAVVQGQSPKLGEKCSSHTECTNNNDNSYCFKYSECDNGICRCKSEYYVSGNGKCTKASGVDKGETCTNKVDQVCYGEGVHCGKCPGGTEYKCRSKASNLYMSASLLFALPAIYKMFL